MKVFILGFLLLVSFPVFSQVYEKVDENRLKVINSEEKTYTTNDADKMIEQLQGQIAWYSAELAKWEAIKAKQIELGVVAVEAELITP